MVIWSQAALVNGKQKHIWVVARISELFNNYPINALEDEMRDDQTAIYNLSQIIKFTRNI